MNKWISLLGASFAISTLVIFTFAFDAYGFFSRGTDLVKKGEVSMQIVERGDEKTFISEAHVYQEGNKLVVSGHVKRFSEFRPRNDYQAHVDLAIYSVGGNLVGMYSANFLPMPWVKSRLSPFEAQFRFFAEKGTVVRLAHHRYPLLSKSSDCGHNAAIEREYSGA